MLKFGVHRCCFVYLLFKFVRASCLGKNTGENLAAYIVLDRAAVGDMV